MENLMGRYRNVSILAAAIFLQIVGLAVQVKRHADNQSSTRLIRVWSVAAITPLEKNLVRVQTGVSSVWNNYLYLRGVRQQNRALEDQIQRLQLEQVRLRQDAEQARRLQALLGFKEQFIDKTTAAQVIGSSGSEQSRIVYLDKGSADGIAPDMAVISAQGIVGKVFQVFRHTCQVLLINDQTSGVGTILEQSRLQGVLKGKASGDLVLDKIMAEEEVKNGDRVLTSGGDQIFPKGLVVGTVAKVTRGPEFLTVTVRPATSLNHLEEVLVITKKDQREPASSPAAPIRAADILAQRLPSVPDKPEQPQAGPGSAAGTSTGATQLKPSPKTPSTAAASTNSAGMNASNSPASAPKTTSQPLPRTQAVDFVRPNASEQVGNAPALPKPRVSTATTQSTTPSQTGTSGTTANAQTVPGITRAGGTSATPSPVKPAGTSAKTGATVSSTGTPNRVAPASAPVNKNSATTTQQPKPPKPAAPATSKPVANTQPATQPDTGDVPQ